MLAGIETAMQPHNSFVPAASDRVFRIMASDYGESTLLPEVLLRLREAAPQLTLDILTPSDVTYLDLEQGRVDMAINRFDELPLSFHQIPLWHDGFACLMSAANPVREHFDLDSYLDSHHVWVSKTGMGVGVGVNPNDKQNLGWVDEALAKIGHKRKITVFTRHYQIAKLLAGQKDLIATIPLQAARLETNNPQLTVLPVPFEIPEIELSMAWSPLLQQNPGHQWLRRLIVDIAKDIAGQ